MARVAIIGGDGKLALRLSRLLTEDDYLVTALFRKPGQTDDVRQTGATIDFVDDDTPIGEAIVGVS